MYRKSKSLYPSAYTFHQTELLYQQDNLQAAKSSLVRNMSELTHQSKSFQKNMKSLTLADTSHQAALSYPQGSLQAQIELCLSRIAQALNMSLLTQLSRTAQARYILSLAAEHKQAQGCKQALRQLAHHNVSALVSRQAQQAYMPDHNSGRFHNHKYCHSDSALEQ